MTAGSANWKDKVHFVLVEPTEPGNVGAAARALKNMGFKNLSLVRPPEMTEEASWFAHNAMDILEGAETFDSLGHALEGKALVFGTSRRTGKNRGMIIEMDDALERISEAALGGGEVAIVLGREQRGLYNHELDECAFLLTLPTDKAQPSLNLGQAVMVFAYEIGKHKPKALAEKKRPPRSEDLPSTYDEQKLLYDQMARILDLLGYTKMGDRNIGRRIMMSLRHLMSRSGLKKRELNMFHGICTRIEKQLESGAKGRPARKGQKEE